MSLDILSGVSCIYNIYIFELRFDATIVSVYGHILFSFSHNIYFMCMCLYDMSHERVLRARESTSRVAGAALADGVLMFCGRVTRLSPSLDPKTLAISSFKPRSHIIYSSNDTHALSQRHIAVADIH